MFCRTLYLYLAATVLLWTIICLAVDVHLHGLLATSDLSESLSWLLVHYKTYHCIQPALSHLPYSFAAQALSSCCRCMFLRFAN
jgi:hypothetical protein